MKEFYIGLMSGTSADGIDAALVHFAPRIKVVGTHFIPYNPAIKNKIQYLYQPGENEIQRLGELDYLLGHAFADTVIDLLKKYSFAANEIQGIGSHGQTIRHHPHQPYPYTLQIGDPNVIAAKTGITTIADFRRRDLAHGGQGAPLVPLFHHYAFSSEEKNLVIANIGGIANITFLPQKKSMAIDGFDTGPGNTLLDTWTYQHQHQHFDQGGAWATTGIINEELLTIMLADPYFMQPPPKSCGQDYFNLAWIQKYLTMLGKKISPADTQATLVEVTVKSILIAIEKYFSINEILVCGGGTHNHFMMKRLTSLATPKITISSTATYGINPDWVEAIAFAWLAQQTLKRQPGNLPSVTGANSATILGGVYYA